MLKYQMVIGNDPTLILYCRHVTGTVSTFWVTGCPSPFKEEKPTSLDHLQRVRHWGVDRWWSEMPVMQPFQDGYSSHLLKGAVYCDILTPAPMFVGIAPQPFSSSLIAKLLPDVTPKHSETMNMEEPTMDVENLTL